MLSFFLNSIGRRSSTDHHRVAGHAVMLVTVMISWLVFSSMLDQVRPIHVVEAVTLWLGFHSHLHIAELRIWMTTSKGGEFVERASAVLIGPLAVAGGGLGRPFGNGNATALSFVCATIILESKSAAYLIFVATFGWSVTLIVVFVIGAIGVIGRTSSELSEFSFPIRGEIWDLALRSIAQGVLLPIFPFVWTLVSFGESISLF